MNTVSDKRIHSGHSQGHHIHDTPHDTHHHNKAHFYNDYNNEKRRFVETENSSESTRMSISSISNHQQSEGIRYIDSNSNKHANKYKESYSESHSAGHKPEKRTGPIDNESKIKQKSAAVFYKWNYLKSNFHSQGQGHELLLFEHLFDIHDKFCKQCSKDEWSRPNADDTMLEGVLPTDRHRDVSSRQSHIPRSNSEGSPHNSEGDKLRLLLQAFLSTDRLRDVSSRQSHIPRSNGHDDKSLSGISHKRKSEGRSPIRRHDDKSLSGSSHKQMFEDHSPIKRHDDKSLSGSSHKRKSEDRSPIKRRDDKSLSGTSHRRESEECSSMKRSGSHHRQLSPTKECESKRMKPLKEQTESDPYTIARRMKNISYGKSTLSYKRYSVAVPREKRKVHKLEHPCTPNVYQVCSRRAWEGQIKAWKKSLHDAWARAEDKLMTLDLGSPSHDPLSTDKQSNHEPPLITRINHENLKDTVLNNEDERFF